MRMPQGIDAPALIRMRGAKVYRTAEAMSSR
jgi:hypothetical protein